MGETVTVSDLEETLSCLSEVRSSAAQASLRKDLRAALDEVKKLQELNKNLVSSLEERDRRIRILEDKAGKKSTEVAAATTTPVVESSEHLRQASCLYFRIVFLCL
jgi:hypothetical protein